MKKVVRSVGIVHFCVLMVVIFWQMNRLKLLTFDITNTILKVKDSPGHQYASVAKHFGVNMSPADLDNVYELVSLLEFSLLP